MKPQLSNALSTIPLRPLDQKLSSFEVKNYPCYSPFLRSIICQTVIKISSCKISKKRWFWSFLAYFEAKTSNNHKERQYFEAKNKNNLRNTTILEQQTKSLKENNNTNKQTKISNEIMILFKILVLFFGIP